MTNAPGTRGREPFEDAGVPAEAEPLFPSEGTFSAVVPLSQVREGQVSVRDSAPEEPEDETTLVPSRVSPAARARRVSARRDGRTTRGGRHWLTMTAAVLLSVTAGVAAGAYMVWTRQERQTTPPVTRAADAAAPSQPASEATQPEPAQEAAPEAAEASAPSAEVVKVERSESAETSAEVGKPEPTSRREAEAERRTSEAERRAPEAGPRAARRARANAEEVEAAPKPGRAETAARRQASPSKPKPNATAAAGRALPVSSPPPSAKTRTVIQWP